VSRNKVRTLEFGEKIMGNRFGLRSEGSGEKGKGEKAKRKKRRIKIGEGIFSILPVIAPQKGSDVPGFAVPG
jgi:hypothetical protein